MHLLWFAIVLGLSQRPAPTRGIRESQPPKPPARHDEQPSQPDQRSTQPAPLVVQISDSVERQRDSAESAEERREKAAADGWTTFLTGGLLLVAIVQAGLFWRQLGIMDQGLIDTKTAADAARRSADAASESVVFAKQAADTQAADMRAMLALTRQAADAASANAEAARDSAKALAFGGRAWLGWTSVRMNGFENATDGMTGEKNLSGTLFAIEWTNSGQSPAVHVNLLSAFQVVDAASPVPHFAATMGILPPETKHAILAPGMTVTSHPHGIREAHLARLRTREVRVFLFGATEYETVFPGDTSKRSEVCLEVVYSGQRTDTGDDMWTFTAVGPQNDAT